MKAVEWFVRELQQRGVKWVATLCGHGLDSFDHAAKQAGLRLVDVRNEQTAAYMAEAHGRLTGEPGVVAVSSGVAHANAMTGVVNAHFDGTPMLLLSGAGPHRTAGMGHFQDLDQAALAGPATKYARVIEQPARTVQILDEAFHAATANPPGPVHLTFPMDIQNTEVAAKDMPRPAPASAKTTTCREDLEYAAELLNQAEQPLIIQGSAVYYNGDGSALANFADRAAVPVVTPIWDRGVIHHPIESFLGVIGAATGGPRLLPEADLILLAGAIPDYRLGFLQPEALREDARILRVDQGWSEFSETYARKGGKSHSAWLAAARQSRQAFQASVEQKAAEQAADRLHALHLIRAIQQLLTGDPVLLIDGGGIGQWAHQLLTDRYPSHWLTCGRSGVVGWGLGGAMGARLTYPDRPVILLSGDGAFTFTVAELECAVRQNLPFVAIVADDEGWGITRAGHVREFGEPITSSLGPVDFAKLAHALGARGLRAETQSEVTAALQESLSSSVPTVIHAPIVGGNP